MLNRQTIPADRRPHRRGPAAGFALRLPARGPYDPRSELHKLIESRSTRPALLGAMMIVAGGMGWYFLPPSAQAVIYSASVLNVLMAVIFAVT